MTSGRGILHEEMPKRGPSGIVNGFQLWVNLPAAQKMGEPRYQELEATNIAVVEADGVKVQVVAGEYGGIQGPVTEITANPLYMDVTLEPGGVFEQKVPTGHTAIAYLFEGEASFGQDQESHGAEVQAVRLVEFEDGNFVRVFASPKSNARFMLIAGAPFGEPIVPYGPFVMNTEEEIRQVFLDLRNGTFAQKSMS